MASELTDEEVSILEIFKPAQKFINDLEFGSSQNDVQARLKTTIENLHAVTRMINQMQLFSSNELIDDVPTSSLPFLMVPVFLGICHENVSTAIAQRAEELTKADIYFRNYLERLIGLTLLDELAFSVKRNDCAAKSAEQIRKAKIDRHRKKKELKALEDTIKRELDAVATVDEGALRDLYMTQLLFWAERAVEEIDSNAQEIEILTVMAAEIKTGQPSRSTEKKPEATPPLVTFTLTRDVQQKNVFGKGYPSIPAMTVDEWYQKRFLGGSGEHGHAHGSSQPPQSSGPAVQGSDDESEDEDAARAKAMRWDEYKDDHRRGWGNMHNKG
uniref:Immunoglobulin-binding protein 1 n=1 Tax=Caenorhabditis japonica TaxID=281687 RepID=A0A8R1EFP6_CAEJA